MGIFRYRAPSINSLLGITKAKKRIKKELGITAAMKPLRAPKNLERKIKRSVGYYSTPAKIARNGLPTVLWPTQTNSKKAKKASLKSSDESHISLEEPKHPALWSLIFGFLYFANHRAWFHSFISLILIVPTSGISWLIYPFFAKKIVRNAYIKRENARC